MEPAKRNPGRRFMPIGEVAERTGLTQRTLRFHEERGLLPPPSRLEGGYRLYSEDDVSRLEVIKRLKHLLGFSLAAIKELIAAEEIKGTLSAELRAEPELEQRIELVDRVEQLGEVQVSLIDQKLERYRQRRAEWAAALADERPKSVEA